MRNDYFKKHKKTIASDTPFRDFITDCIGSTIPLQKERDLLIEERKKQNKPYLFKYEPAINKKITETSTTIFTSPWAAATKPALKRIESPGRKKPSSTPVSTKTIAPINTYKIKGEIDANCSSKDAANSITLTS